MCDRYGHLWTYTIGLKVPEGTPCDCGGAVAHYEKCPTCGQERLVAVLIKQDEPNIEIGGFCGFDDFGNPLTFWIQG